MGLKRTRIDSIKELREKKDKVARLEQQLTDTQLALCDVYEQLVTALSGEGGKQDV